MEHVYSSQLTHIFQQTRKMLKLGQTLLLQKIDPRLYILESATQRDVFLPK